MQLNRVGRTDVRLSAVGFGTCQLDCRLPISNECPGAHPWCNPATGLCADCLFDAHCTGGTVCDEWATWTCIPSPREPAPDAARAEPAAEVVSADEDAAPPAPAGRGCAGGPAATPPSSLAPLAALSLLRLVLSRSRRRGRARPAAPGTER